MGWLINHLMSLLLFIGLSFTTLAAILMVMSVEVGKRAEVIAEVKQAVRFGVRSSLRFGQQFYASKKADELLESMGWRPYISAASLKMIRDAVSLLLLLIVFLTVSFGQQMVRPLIGVAFAYLTLTPGPGPFRLFIRPVFQRIRRHRVNQETALFIQLLRNETQSEVQQTVIAIIRQFRPYMKVLQDDMYLLEHEWRDKEQALEHWKMRHPENEDIRFICSLLKKIEDIGYADCQEMLQQNEVTINQRQVTYFRNRMNDLNKFLVMVNAAGVLLGLLWFVMTFFSWAFDMDTGL